MNCIQAAAQKKQSSFLPASVNWQTKAGHQAGNAFHLHGKLPYKIHLKSASQIGFCTLESCTYGLSSKCFGLY